MKKILKRLFLVTGCLMLASLAACVSAPRPESAILLRLDDVQGFSGGQTLVLDSSGNLFVRKVDHELKESGFHMKLPAEEFTALREFVGSSGIKKYQEKSRPGVPDEARPLITLTLPGESKVKAMKWVNDKDPKFDKLYDRLLELVEKAARGTPYQKGDYDYKAAFP